MIDKVIKDQIEYNLKSFDGWEIYHSHRQKILEIIVSKSICSSDRLCILGAGNCNDLDLNILVNKFREVHLVDLDNQALQNGISRQNLNNCSNLYIHGKIDLTKSLWFLSEFYQKSKPSEDDVKKFIQETNLSLNLNITEPFEIVVSVCMLTQLINTIIFAIGSNHPWLPEFILKIRNHHLNQLASLIKPNGWGLLITDIVSSDSCAEIATTPEEKFPFLVNKLILAQNFFHGVNPYKISSTLSSNPLLFEVRMLHSWGWNFGPRIYAVCAIEAQKIS